MLGRVKSVKLFFSTLDIDQTNGMHSNDFLGKGDSSLRGENYDKGKIH